MTICVFGSLNMDLVLQTYRLPLPGETVEGRNFVMAPGGKGANQAVAIGRLNQPVEMIGMVGEDDHGKALLEHLRAQGIGLEGVATDPTTHSGIALIAASDSGDNQIVLAPGANGNLAKPDLERLKPLLAGADLLLMQMEVPTSVVLEAARMAKAADVRVILDPAPAPAMLPDELYELVDVLTPNHTEAERLAGFGIDTPMDAMRAATLLQRFGASHVVVTLGAQGAFYATADTTIHIPIFTVPVVDSIAAGDAFNGAMAVALTEGCSYYEAMIWGSAAGALTVSRRGAQSSLPSRDELDEFLSTHVAEDPTYY